jgi:hypothetical protein
MGRLNLPIFYSFAGFLANYLFCIPTFLQRIRNHGYDPEHPFSPSTAII